ncbi:hypothetical protein N7516_004745 [Penicillium verrucosum]|uniref:uncharacterized protein n=1 Tax=Penicillium verrucosum TaxID=60171 RepID=UPI00254562BA|nr:uncharacterized protein N7516_004745 [Penicillium verrucosum]KAJ5944577.1 hypothetical protein N7516_004745 [Penicillium verrucosum]
MRILRISGGILAFDPLGAAYGDRSPSVDESGARLGPRYPRLSRCIGAAAQLFSDPTRNKRTVVRYVPLGIVIGPGVARHTPAALRLAGQITRDYGTCISR